MTGLGKCGSACYLNGMRHLTAIAFLLLTAPAMAAGPSLTGDQSALRGRLDHAFLEAGANLQVLVVSDPKSTIVPKGSKFPVLLLWTQALLGRPDVYQIQTKLDVLNEARKVAFGTVVFYGASVSGTGSMYSFDVSKPGQSCARDLCF